MKQGKVLRIKPVRAHIVSLEAFIEKKRLSHFRDKEKALKEKFAKAMKWASEEVETKEDSLI